MAAHWLACFWGYIGRIGEVAQPIDVDTWYVPDRHNQSWIEKHQLTEASDFEIYSVCVYVALSNIFGSPRRCSARPQNTRRMHAHITLRTHKRTWWTRGKNAPTSVPLRVKMRTRIR